MPNNLMCQIPADLKKSLDGYIEKNDVTISEAVSKAITHLIEDAPQDLHTADITHIDKRNILKVVADPDGEPIDVRNPAFLKACKHLLFTHGKQGYVFDHDNKQVMVIR